MTTNPLFAVFEDRQEPNQNFFLNTPCRYVPEAMILNMGGNLRIDSANNNTCAFASKGGKSLYQQQIPSGSTYNHELAKQAGSNTLIGPRVRCYCRRCRRSRSASCFRSCRGRIQHCVYIQALPNSKSHCSSTRRNKCGAG
jgi:hypothetical protein